MSGKKAGLFPPERDSAVGREPIPPGSGSEAADVVPLRRRFQRSTRAGEDDRLEVRAIAGAKQADWDAIHYLYASYADDVRAYVRSIVNDSHEAEDITQGVFARLIDAIGKYERRDAPFGSWLMRVARNAALDHLRSHRQIPVRAVDEPETEAQLIAERKSLRDAFEQLPAGQRTVLVMRHLIRLSPTEIARRLGKSEGSVHALHHRGRRALQARLRELELVPSGKRRS